MRRLRPRRSTVFIGVLTVLARVFDAGLLFRRARRGPWRAEVREESMVPSLLPGDWLLLDPTCRRWPRAGTIVVVREPETGILAIKRVAARGRPTRLQRDDRGRGGPLEGGPLTVGQLEGGGPRQGRPLEDAARRPPGPLGAREAWVLGDAPDGSVDSRRYGPLDADDLVARAWFRYGPTGRLGRLR